MGLNATGFSHMASLRAVLRVAAASDRDGGPRRPSPCVSASALRLSAILGQEETRSSGRKSPSPGRGSCRRRKALLQTAAPGAPALRGDSRGPCVSDASQRNMVPTTAQPPGPPGSASTTPELISFKAPVGHLPRSPCAQSPLQLGRAGAAGARAWKEVSGVLPGQHRWYEPRFSASGPGGLDALGPVIGGTVCWVGTAVSQTRRLAARHPRDSQPRCPPGQRPPGAQAGSPAMDSYGTVSRGHSGPQLQQARVAGRPGSKLTAGPRSPDWARGPGQP